MPPKKVTDEDNSSTTTIKSLLTKENWDAWSYSIEDASCFDALDPDSAVIYSDADQRTARIYLKDRVHLDLMWILQSCCSKDPRVLFTALKNELGCGRQDADTAIANLKMIRINGKDFAAYSLKLATAVNDLRKLGVSIEKFGPKDVIEAYITGLNVDRHNPGFDTLQTALLLEFASKSWVGKDIMDLETVKRQIIFFIQKKLTNYKPPRKDQLQNRDFNKDFNKNSNKNQNDTSQSNSNVKACAWCKSMGGNAAINAGTHTVEDCGFRKRADRANAAIQSSNKQAEQYLILDSGASKNMIKNSSYLFDYEVFDKPRQIMLGDSSTIDALGKGTLLIKSTINGSVDYFPFYNTLHVPRLDVGLISVPVMMRNGVQMDWNNPSRVDIYRNGKVLLHATLKDNNMLQIQGSLQQVSAETSRILKQIQTERASPALTDGENFLRWHRILGHCGSSTLLKTVPLVTGIDLQNETSMPACADCKAANATQNPHHTSVSKASNVGDLIHTDILVMTERTMHGELYSVNFTDDATHYNGLYLLKTKASTEVFEAFKKFVAALQTNHGNDITVGTVRIKVLRSDNDGAYEGPFVKHLAENGIKHEYSINYDHPQNGLSERMNRTLGEKERAQRFYADLPIPIWGYSLQFANYVNLRTYTSTEPTTPFERLHHTKPDLSGLHPFGTPAVVHIPKETRSKSDPHGIRCRYLGPSNNHSGDIFIECATNLIRYSRDATFYEDWKTNPTCTTGFEINFPDHYDSDDEYAPEPEEILVAPAPAPEQANPPPHEDDLSRRRTRGNQKPPGFYNALIVEDNSTSASDSSSPLETSDIKPQPSTRHPEETAPKSSPTHVSWWDTDEEMFDFDAYHAFITVTASHAVPKSLKEAQKSKEWPQWKMAMLVELRALHGNSTWKYVKRAQYHKRKTIKCKWVFTKKFNHDGSLNKFKARLVARGYTQRHGIDYEETFAPTMALKSFRILVAMAAAKGRKLYQADVPTAFIRSDLEEEVIMEPPEIPVDMELPEGFERCSPEELCLLMKSLYGLKQAPRAWFGTLRKFLLTLGFTQSAADPCIYTLNHEAHGEMTAGVYVDDLLYFGDDAAMKWIMEQLTARFNIKSLGLAQWFLGIHIHQDESGSITLDQTQYVTDFLKEFGMLRSHAVSTPLVHNYSHILSTFAGDPVDFKPPINASYNQVVGKIMYAMVATRPDICAAVGIASRYLKSPQSVHWDLLLRILQYLNSTKDFGITFTPDASKTAAENITPQVWVDADFANDPEQARSISGFGIKMCNGPVVWYSKKQSTTALSTAEAEYIAACMCAKIVTWLRQLLADLGHPQLTSTILHEDNQSCIALAINPQVNQKTAHIQVKFHYVQEMVENKTIKMEYCKSLDQVADIFTKGLPRVQFQNLRKMFGLSSLGGSVGI
jgi:hypothetical protein